MSTFTSTVSVLVTLTIETDTEPTDDQLVEAGIALKDSVERATWEYGYEKAAKCVPSAQNVQCTVHFDDHDINVDEYTTVEEDK